MQPARGAPRRGGSAPHADRLRLDVDVQTRTEATLNPRRVPRSSRSYGQLPRGGEGWGVSRARQGARGPHHSHERRRIG